uniref:RNA-binding S4 domain-containing protein n=1 Tax=Physcomitrium patens TaxID=3218 RepID=A0A2K1IG66_PHYPA|nr:hypothetical protein PHYPA_028864 [Physcomitrium patens]
MRAFASSINCSLSSWRISWSNNLFRSLCLSLAWASLSTTLVLIKQRHIRIGKKIVDDQTAKKHIDFALCSPFGGGKPGRVKRKNTKSPSKKASGGDDEQAMKILSPRNSSYW